VSTPSTPPHVVEVLRAQGVARSYPAGSLLFDEGDPPGPTLLVTAGAVEVTTTAAGTIATVVVDGLVGELSAVDGLPRSASARAVTDVEVRAIEPARFVQLLDDEPELCLHVLRLLVSRVRRTTVDRGPVGQGVPVDRLARWILGHRGADDWVELSLEQVADELGSSRELLSRATDHLVGQGAVALERGRLLVRSTDTLATLARPPDR
jgi:CRP/FNR family transcriptional regulator, cyclic AMP receptor protein